MFSPSGDLLAWSTGQEVKLSQWQGDSWHVKSTLEHSRVSFMGFSPRGSVLATWELFATRAGQRPTPNMHLWDAATGEKIASFVQKKSAGWCPQWSADEEICCLRGQNNEAFFYRSNNFSQVEARLSLPKLESFTMSPGSTCHVVCFIPGQKGGPGFAKLYKYPNFHTEKDVLATKSFFQADRLEAEWSSDGRHVLLLTQAEVDKTGASYYGKQQLHFMSATSGDTAMVQLAKDGPIYHIGWSPRASEFCVVYGYMPAKATLFNHKCEKVFDFGTGPRNASYYNPQGNLLILGGFGNLRGNIEVWSVTDNKKRVCQFEAADSTDLKWSPDGKCIMTSTCAPRLRQGNGFKIWHYTSSLLHEAPLEPTTDELWEVSWQNDPELGAKDFQVQFKPVAGIAPMQPQASKQAYRPPGMRNKPASKLHDEDELAENEKKGSGEPMSKSAAKNKKRREAQRKKKEEEAGQETRASNAEVTSAEDGVSAAFVPTGDVEKDKKLRKLHDKLQQIQKLKQQQREGKQLELNQLEKIKKEADFVAEMKALKM